MRKSSKRHLNSSKPMLVKNVVTGQTALYTPDAAQPDLPRGWVPMNSSKKSIYEGSRKGLRGSRNGVTEEAKDYLNQLLDERDTDGVQQFLAGRSGMSDINYEREVMNRVTRKLQDEYTITLEIRGFPGSATLIDYDNGEPLGSVSYSYVIRRIAEILLRTNFNIEETTDRLVRWLLEYT